MNLAHIHRDAAHKHPHRLAISAPDGDWTYAELDGAANRAAALLKARGIGPGHRVGLWHPKAARVVVMMQATLRVGAAYVPIDPGSPLERVKKILANCQLSALVTDTSRAETLDDAIDAELLRLDVELEPCLSNRSEPPTEEDQVPVVEVAPDDLAYILYTSGSTGTPKGVCLSHRNATAFIHWASSSIDASAEDAFSNHAPFHFDLSVFDLYVPATAGASVSIIPEGVAYMPRRLVRFIRHRDISVWYSVPSALIMMMEHGGIERLEPAHHPRVVVFAGEPFPIHHLRRLRRLLPRTRLFNYYGPTETNVCTAYEVRALTDHDTSIPIGHAASGDRVWAQRPDGSTALPGEEGELYVDGPTVLIGYWGAEPWRGPYPTGDLVRVRPDGAYDYVGRRDQMVKVRGHRVELGEVETALEAHASVHRAAAVVSGQGLDKRIVVFLLGTGANKASFLELKASCAQLLPRYMIPDRVIWVEELPLTANGKLDRRALTQSLESKSSETTNAA